MRPWPKDTSELTGHHLSLAAMRWLRTQKRCSVVMMERGPMYWRPDAFGISPGRYGIEVEAKVTTSDFHADREKRHNKARDKGLEHDSWVRQFYYIVPPDLVDNVKDAVPSWAGLLVCKGPWWSDVVKKAPVNKHARQYKLNTVARCVAQQTNQLMSIVEEMLSMSEGGLHKRIDELTESLKCMEKQLKEADARYWELRGTVARERIEGRKEKT